MSKVTINVYLYPDVPGRVLVQDFDGGLCPISLSVVRGMPETVQELTLMGAYATSALHTKTRGLTKVGQIVNKEWRVSV